MATDRQWDTCPVTVHALTAEQRRRAVLTVAATARDAEDVIELSDMLGLRAEDARPRATVAGEPVSSGPPAQFYTELAALARSRQAAGQR